MEEILIRPACPADVEVLYTMLCDLENEMLDKEHFVKIFLKNLENQNVSYFIAELDRQSVGMASCHVQLLLHHAAPVGEIQEMYVKPELRSQGIGQRLVEAVKTFSHQRGADQLEVTSNQIRRDTHRFYEREGFIKSHVKLVRK
ncbi:GNAT family N-acetyltransferase [Salmonirosea aquatica]|uniref:GNAT family N-acetyltransferase n=1 Tax=Salmonirosea aquatica TaxID=2654236 RepID=A0A7C9FPW6_9BACT|nr:GNAT family N-acetyltransferase [Cytophagaceae bacterium SJW1-29]